jgi:hypothetical protein
MFAIQVEAAISGTKSLARLDDYSRDIWKVWAAGSLSDDDAQRLATLIEARKAETRPLDTVRNRAPGVAIQIGQSFFPPKRRQVCPDRAAAMERRRRLAFSGPMPPALACRFTTGALAALRIVADEVRAKGRCSLSLSEIAARAGVGVTTARNAVREASREGLLTIQERRRHMRPNLPNTVRIISREWLAWITKGGGSKKAKPTDIGIRKPSVYAEGTAALRGDNACPTRPNGPKESFEEGRGRNRGS